jgi:hypothetical protein
MIFISFHSPWDRSGKAGTALADNALPGKAAMDQASVMLRSGLEQVAIMRFPTIEVHRGNVAPRLAKAAQKPRVHPFAVKTALPQ